MFEILKNLTPEQQAWLCAAIATALAQLVRWAMAKGGRELGDSTFEKVQKLLIAAATAALATLATTGPTVQFWGQWAVAFAGAVAIHERKRFRSSRVGA